MQQHFLATKLVERLGYWLIPYDELVSTGREASLSPLDLEHRLLVKGKIKSPKKTTKSCKTMKHLSLLLSKKSSRRSKSSPLDCGARRVQAEIETTASSPDSVEVCLHARAQPEDQQCGGRTRPSSPSAETSNRSFSMEAYERESSNLTRSSSASSSCDKRNATVIALFIHLFIHRPAPN
eukprot:4738292-Prymnesium_polylepis.1